MMNEVSEAGEMKNEKGNQKFDFFLVLDVEATCLKDMRINPQEVIQIACVLCEVTESEFKVKHAKNPISISSNITSQFFCVTDNIFDTKVKPIFKEKLSPFCSKLTGITQDDVNEAPVFKTAFANFVHWLQSLDQKLRGKNVAFLTCGDFDLKQMLPDQCSMSGIKFPEAMENYINIKREFERLTNMKINRAENDLEQIMRHLEMTFQGRLHNAEDDVNNIARVAAMLWRDHDLRLRNEGELKPWTRIEFESDMEPHFTAESKIPKEIMEIIKNGQPLKQDFDYILAMDFEATCLKGMKIDPQEIIEFPCVVIDCSSMEVKNTFHRYVRPVFHPRLSPFCFKLTGISQNTIDSSKTFREVLDEFEKWIKDEGLEDKNLLVATCGDWDLKTCLPQQMRASFPENPEERTPRFLKTWANVKEIFTNATEVQISRHENDMMQMIRTLGLTFEGQLHSGKDDTKNLAKVIATLSKLVVFKATE